MDIKQRTKEELEERIKKIEKFIGEKGLGSGYLARAKRIQRNINLVLFLGTFTTVAGLMAWILYKTDED